MELAFKFIGINIEVAASAVLQEGHGSAQIRETVASLRQQFVRMSEPRDILDGRRQFGDPRLQNDEDERRQEVIGSGISSALGSALQECSQRSARFDNAIQLYLRCISLAHLFGGRRDVLDLLELFGDGFHGLGVLLAHLGDLEVVGGEELEVLHLLLELLVLLRESRPHDAERQVAQLLHDHLLDAVPRVYRSPPPWPALFSPASPAFFHALCLRISAISASVKLWIRSSIGCFCCSCSVCGV